MQEFLQLVKFIVSLIVVIAVISANANYKNEGCQCNPKECSNCPFPCEKKWKH